MKRTPSGCGREGERSSGEAGPRVKKEAAFSVGEKKRRWLIEEQFVPIWSSHIAFPPTTRLSDRRLFYGSGGSRRSRFSPQRALITFPPPSAHFCAASTAISPTLTLQIHQRQTLTSFCSQFRGQVHANSRHCLRAAHFLGLQTG